MKPINPAQLDVVTGGLRPMVFSRTGPMGYAPGGWKPLSQLAGNNLAFSPGGTAAREVHLPPQPPDRSPASGYYWYNAKR
jgi:hypothetical protein